LKKKKLVAYVSFLFENPNKREPGISSGQPL
jgi:hypothetical protein